MKKIKNNKSLFTLIQILETHIELKKSKLVNIANNEWLKWSKGNLKELKKHIQSNLLTFCRLTDQSKISKKFLNNNKQRIEIFENVQGTIKLTGDYFLKIDINKYNKHKNNFLIWELI